MPADTGAHLCTPPRSSLVQPGEWYARGVRPGWGRDTTPSTEARVRPAPAWPSSPLPVRCDAHGQTSLKLNTDFVDGLGKSDPEQDHTVFTEKALEAQGSLSILQAKSTQHRDF